MSPELIQVNSKALLKRYIYLPPKIYRNYKNWVPPVYSDEWKFHDPRFNKSLQHSDVVRVIASKDGKAVGRIMGIIHKKYNAQHGERTARFFQVDCIDDTEVAHALIQYVEQWAGEKGMNKVIGPFGFSDKDPQGLQIKGFEYLPVIAAPSNPPYLQQLVETEGYIKEIDCVSFRFDVPPVLLPVFEKVYERIKQNHNLQLLEFKTRKQMKPFILPVLHLVNETYRSLFGFIEMTEEEMQRLAAQYIPILNPEFVKVVTTTEEELVGFIVAMPDLSTGLQKAKGRLFPFGFVQILRAMKKAKQLNSMLGAIKQNYRGLGIDALIGVALMRSAAKRGFTVIDSHLVLETNTKMCSEFEKVGGKICKRYRIYGKVL